MKIIPLTKAEEQVMQVLWELEKGFVKDVIEKLPGKNKPAYNTISTIIRILEKKGFIGHTDYGKTYEYYPLISKPVYTKHFMGSFMKDYFSNSYKHLVSFFTNENNMSLAELEELKKIMDKEIKKKKNGRK
ncbi:MAG: BlaI/MecI/CopY family transcriptional regulator [Ignavibacteria bacterium]|jgi:predicted transcriptional regulator